MKIFCLTFIFYLLTLSWQPCNDLSSRFSACKSDFAAEAVHLDETKTSDESDDCSPFCICSCCQISTVYANLNFTVTSAPFASIEKTTGSFYQSSYSHQSLDLIWQPPKI